MLKGKKHIKFFVLIINLTTKRTTKAEVDSLINNNSVISLYAKLNDKFGENGLVSVICGAIDEDQVVIDLWLMSCRVFKRTLENSVINEFLKIAKSKKLNSVIGKYIPTPKNKIVSNLYEDIGFSLKSETETLKIFELDLKKFEIEENDNILVNKAITKELT